MGQPKLCLLRGQPQTPALSLTLSLCPRSQRTRKPLAVPSGPSMQEVDTRQQGCCQNHFSHPCSVYYHFVNLWWGEGRDNLLFNKVGDVDEDVSFWPCRKRPTEGPLRQCYQWAPCRVGVPGLACSGAPGRGAESQASPLQLITQFGFFGEQMGYSHSAAPSCPTGKPWSHPLSQQDAPGLEQRELQRPGGGAWPSLMGPTPQLQPTPRTVPQAWSDQFGSCSEF